MSLFDTHAHLYDESLRHQLHSVLERAAEQGVHHVCCIGTDLETSRASLDIARRHPAVSAVLGFQPNHCRDLGDRDWQELLGLIEAPEVVGIGETGLDRYWNDCPFEIQWQWFERHLKLSLERSVPMVIHMRDCEADIVAFLRRYQTDWPLKGIMHSFTGTWETAQVALDAGLHVSFAGMVTYKSSVALREVARQVPPDRLLVETDSPYLSPEPFRGQRPNEPARVRATAECLANVRGVTLEELSQLTTRNACQLFRLPLAEMNSSGGPKPNDGANDGT